MPTEWELVGNDVDKLIALAAGAHYPEITDTGLTIRALYATAGEDEGPPLAINKYPQAAIIKATSARDRIAGKADVELFIDKAQWGELSKDERAALIDHELHHIEFKRHPQKKGGGIKYDCAQRPCIGMKMHDWQIGGFREIAERHGDAALEVQNARLFSEKFGQYVFSFAASHK